MLAAKNLCYAFFFLILHIASAYRKHNFLKPRKGMIEQLERLAEKVSRLETENRLLKDAPRFKRTMHGLSEAARNETQNQQSGARDGIDPKILNQITDTLVKASAAGINVAGQQGAYNSNSPTNWHSRLNNQIEEGTIEVIPFGKHVPREAGKNYIIASGEQECQLCVELINEAYVMGTSYHNLCYKPSRGSDNFAMCEAQRKVLQSCPEFVNNWCYQDLGGTQTLRSPCPNHLKCHYCLGINPLHCLLDHMRILD